MSAAAQSGWEVVGDEPTAAAAPAAPAATAAPTKPPAQPHEDAGDWGVTSDEADKPDTPKPPEKTPLGFGKNILTSGANLLTNVVKSIIPYDATNWNDAIPLKRASDSLFDLLWGTGRLAAKHLGVENMPTDPDSLKADQATQAMRDYISHRYGSFDRFKDAWYQDPAGMAADLSMVLSGGAGVAKGVGLTGTAKVLGKAAEISNPMFLPGKLAGATVKGLTKPKPTAAAPPPPPEGAPAFDPKTGAFSQEFDPFDPSTGSYKSPPDKAPPAAESEQDTVNRLRTEWGVKTPKGGMEPPPQAAPPPKPPPQAAPPPPQPAPAPAGSPIAQEIRNYFSKNKGPIAGVIATDVIGMLTHHLAAGVGGGLIVGGAIKLLPKLINSEAGQRMLSRLGPGSTAAEVAAVARDMAPALNTMYQSQLKDQSMGQHSALDSLGRAKGGMVNPELARIQRERLQLPGILAMLEKK